MKKNIYPGKFIVFEGLDGSGQSTQAKLLAEFLKRKKHQVLTTKEPTLDSAAGKLIRLILDKKKKVSPQKLQELFAQDRKVHLNGLIIPNLKKGKIVISDRYCFSSFTYGSLGVPLKNLLKLNDRFLLPDLIFFLDVKPATCLTRIKKRNKDRTLFEEENKLKKVYQNYKKIIKKFKNVVVINGERSISRVHQEIKKHV
jgi:dTMP kinase